MKLRSRLLSITLATVAVVVVAMAALNLNSLVAAWLDSAIERSEVAGRQVRSFMLRRIEEGAAGQTGGLTTLAATKQLWSRIVANDTDLAAMLEQSMAQSRSIVEIHVAGEDGLILASSNPARRGTPMIARQELHQLRLAGMVERLRAMLGARQDYESRVLIGIADQTAPVFTIQILVSPVLLSAAAWPELRNLMLVSAVALSLACLLAWWSANLALRPLARISHLLDDMVSGKTPALVPARGADELAAIESKLNLLGERVRDAREDASQVRLELLDAETRRHVESQMALARRLTAIHSLTGRVAHEIKNPLNSIALRLELLRAEVAEEAPHAVNEIAVLSEEVTRLDRVVRTFLDFNRPVEMELEDVDVAGLASELVHLLEPEAAQKHIAVTFDRPAGPVTIKGDAGLLRQALLNIAVNGIEAMTEGGQLSWRVAATGETCTVAIGDTGPGIPADQRERIFQLYFTTKQRGSGIGLAMTFRAVQLHGGTIEVQSEVGRGTTFLLMLPLSGTDQTV
jgi:signal transduction histidine kinase